MAEGIRISELGEVNSLQDGCCFPVISEIDGKMRNVKIKKQKLAAQLLEQFNTAITPRLNQLQSSISQVDNKDNYSKSAVVIGKWIDGRPVYRRVFQWKEGTESKATTSIRHTDGDSAENPNEWWEYIDHYYRTITISGLDFYIDGMRIYHNNNFKAEIYEHNQSTNKNTNHTSLDDYLIVTYVKE